MRRSGFTLLEMVLALSIGVALLGALYLTMDSQLRMVDAGRDALDEASVARAIFARIQQDMTACLGARDPRLLPDMAAPAVDPAASNAAASDAAADPAATTDPAAATGSSSTTPPPSTTPMSTITTGGRLFNYGIRGDAASLNLSSSRVPRELVGRDKLQLSPGSLPKVSDLRRVVYWYVEGKGLARRESSNATGDDIDLQPGDLADAEPYIIAPEVQSLSLQYFDGSASQTNWDSSTIDFEAEVPLGPPAAVIIELKIGLPNGPARIWRQTIAIPTSNNFPRSGG
ncbi:MAG: prepilin-type N-terminal cleavage/methylation domain-containing protein [Gemmataceae bacterium]|nr:prepilin-type N-terminal cleavage/methylation domain-containing protein [Gemmataceae bacterium]